MLLVKEWPRSLVGLVIGGSEGEEMLMVCHSPRPCVQRKG
jgi:hypothetical protein